MQAPERRSLITSCFLVLARPRRAFPIILYSYVPRLDCDTLPLGFAGCCVQLLKVPVYICSSLDFQLAQGSRRKLAACALPATVCPHHPAAAYALA
jgi:hypothetical protein